MSSKAKSKLSLKKKTQNESKKSQGNTILSMFQNQKQKHGNNKDDSIFVTESGSEGDVIITDVCTTETAVTDSKKQPENANKRENNNKDKSSDSAHKSTSNGAKRSRQSAKRKIRDNVLNSTKKNKISRTSEVGTQIRIDHSDAESDDFVVTAHSTKKSKDRKEDGESKGKRGSDKKQTRYTLRRRRTVPIIDASDSENSESEVGNVDSVESKNSANKGNSTKVEDLDDVIVLEEVETQSRFFNSSKKRDRSLEGSRKLTLKKAKTEGDKPSKKGVLLQSEGQRKPTESFNSKGVKSNEEVIRNEDCKLKDTPVKAKINDQTVSTDIKDTKTIREENTGMAQNTKSKATSTLSKGNFLAKLKADIEKKQPVNTNKETNDLKQKINKTQTSNNNKDTPTALEIKQTDSSESQENSINLSQSSSASTGVTNKAKPVTKTEVLKNSQKVKRTKVYKNSKVDNDDNNDDDSDDDDDNDESNVEQRPEYRVPYYLENFTTILSSVLGDKEYSKLFNESDMRYVETFNNMQEPSQKLYVRLFSRKLAWLPMSRLAYPEISDDIPALVDGLIASGLLLSGEDLDDLPVILRILPAPELKMLAKSFHINVLGLTKHKIIECLVKKGQQSSISTMFHGGGSGNMEKTILRRAKTYIDKVCRLQEEGRAVFMRVVMLFSLYHTNFDEDNTGGGSGQLFQMLMVNIGRVVYPTFTVNRQTSIFKDRDALARFERALQFEMEIESLTERGKWTAAFDAYNKAKDVGKEICTNKEYLSWDQTLPQFLRLYTAGSVYTRIDNYGVEILQRLKQYPTAVRLLEELLGQDVYCENYRGHWYERLALNLEAHLKSPRKSLEMIERGLSDRTVRVGRRYALYERARKLCEAPKSKFADWMSRFQHDRVRPTPEVEIEGMVMSDAASMGIKYQFIMQGDTDSVTLCGVEELVLEHYRQNGFPEGLHAEGSIISNLFVLLCWDVLFMDVADVFHGAYQSCPLDIVTQDFYWNRRQAIDDRLKWLTEASIEEITAEVERVWREHEGEMVAGITWDKFSGPETHQHLVSCMGGAVVAGVLGRFMKDPRHTRSGFPDLTLWNYETRQLKVCEVKSPNDRLSYKQILWIDYLLNLGVDAEVCYVKAVGSKRLKRQT